MRDTATRVWVFRLRLILASFSLISVATRANGAQVIDLRDGSRTTFYGDRFHGIPSNGDFYGWAMAFGDIDADGYTDFISSSTNSEGPNDSHEPGHDVYVFFGRPRAAFDSLYAIDNPGVADIVIYRGGHAIACRDIDRDGHDDLILAEHGGYVIFGGQRGDLRAWYDLDSTSPTYTPADITITGTFNLGGGTNFPVGDWGIIRGLVAGDLNDDGYADLVIGDPTANLGRISGGATFVIFGRARGLFPSVIDTDPASALPHPDVTVLGKGSDLYPFDLAIGDLDGDGTDDLVASTTRGAGEEIANALSGEVHCLFGRTQWKGLYDMQIEEFDFAVTGTRSYQFGYRMCMGDLDGDGRDELVVGSPWTNLDDVPDDRSFPGEYRIFFGRPRGMWSKWNRVNEATDVFILGASSGDANLTTNPSPWKYAFSISTGNYDGDRYDDLIIGASFAAGPDESRRGAGEVNLLRGRPRGHWDPFIDLRDGFDLLAYGAEASPSLGYEFDLLGFTTGFGDVDDNGLDDLFMSAICADGPDNFFPDVGEVHILFSDDSTSVAVDPKPTPYASTALLPNYPNPFHQATILRFRASADDVVSLTVYDVAGREVARPLVPQRALSRDVSVAWDARDSSGRQLPSGVYFVKLRAGTISRAQKVLLVR